MLESILVAWMVTANSCFLVTKTSDPKLRCMHPLSQINFGLADLVCWHEGKGGTDLEAESRRRTMFCLGEINKHHHHGSASKFGCWLIYGSTK